MGNQIDKVKLELSERPPHLRQESDGTFYVVFRATFGPIEIFDAVLFGFSPVPSEGQATGIMRALEIRINRGFMALPAFKANVVHRTLSEQYDVPTKENLQQYFETLDAYR